MKITMSDPAVTTYVPIFVDPAGGQVPGDQAIQSLRRMCGMTSAQFGALIGVSGRTVDGWCQGRPVDERSIWRINHHLAGGKLGTKLRAPKVRR